MSEHTCALATERYDLLTDKLDKLIDAQAKHQVDLVEVKTNVGIWLGNGKPGIIPQHLSKLVERVDSLEQFRDKHEASCRPGGYDQRLKVLENDRLSAASKEVGKKELMQRARDFLKDWGALLATVGTLLAVLQHMGKL